MVWNVTSDGVKERMTVVTQDAWPVRGPRRQPPPEPGRPDPISPAIEQGRLDTSDVEKKLLDEWRDLHDLGDVDWRKPRKQPGE